MPCHFLVADRSGHSFVWEYSRGHNREHIVESHTPGPLVCTNHLLHRWPDPAQLPHDPLTAGTAAFTYDRWRTLHGCAADTPVVDAERVRNDLNTVRFTSPTPGVRTVWQAIYDLDDPSLELSFFTGDHNGTSQYTEPLRFQLDSDTPPDSRQRQAEMDHHIFGPPALDSDPRPRPPQRVEPARALHQ